MTSVTEEIKRIKEYLEMQDELEKDVLIHYGMPKRSGRYPYGSGKDPYQRSGDFLSRVENLKKKGLSEKEIAYALGITTTKLREQKTAAKNERRSIEVAAAKSLKEDGLGPTAIANKLSERFGRNINESTVRGYLQNKEAEAKMNKAKETAEFIKKQIESKGMIDVGVGISRELGISDQKLNQALNILEEEGYPVYKGGIPNITNPGVQINQKVICPKGTEHKEIYNFDQVHTLNEYTSRDGGSTFEKFHYPESLSSKRIKINYDEDGGTLKDGIVELRPGVKDLSLGNQHYSQVRILVDNNKYIKGMALYGDPKDFPKGVDVIVNSNKKRSQGMGKALKDIEDDPDNPFGSTIKANGQSFYDDPKGKFKDPITGKKQSLSKINKRAEEGDWEDWKDKLPSQFLSKQDIGLANKQLGKALNSKRSEYEEIMSLPNPTVKKNRLRSFAEDCDAAAVNLQAAALPGQKYHVIIPNNSLSDRECYCPRYANGTKLALVRYPHGGTFEIPIVTVNNRNNLGQKLIGKQTSDAICINHKIAARLSGADFDGDTVMCIPTHGPNGKIKIKSTSELDGLKGFEPKDKYAIPEGNPNKRPIMAKGSIQKEMGGISNLISDMNIKGAGPAELTQAVRHSMVVIDAHKHKLDYKQSEVDNNIKALKEKWQGASNAGASTIISRASGQTSVIKRQGSPKVNIKGKEWYDPSRPEGSLIYKTSDKAYYPDKKYDKKGNVVLKIEGKRGETISYNPKDSKQVAKYKPTPKTNKDGSVSYTNPNGDIKYKTKYKNQKSVKMLETDDARTLMSEKKTPMEQAYASYANSMKDLANKSRVQVEKIGRVAYSTTEKKKYEKEYNSLKAKKEKAFANKPKERTAHRLANAEVEAKIEDNPHLKGDKEKIKKLKQQAITKYRNKLGAKQETIYIEDKEWEAIQSHAIPETLLEAILTKADNDRLNELCMPRAKTQMSDAKIARAKNMANSNHTISEIAKALGVSSSTISSVLNDK